MEPCLLLRVKCSDTIRKSNQLVFTAFATIIGALLVALGPSGPRVASGKAC